jgi:hypothetical protein
MKLDAPSGRQHICNMIRPTSVSSLPDYKIKVSYPDGVEGIIDLSESVGKGVFTPLEDKAFFKTVHVGRYGQIAWSEDIEICPDAAYFEIAGKWSSELCHA